MSSNSLTTCKLSPFGSGINKNLLTPCRRVGLSRKRKTPNSLLKLLPDDLNNSNDSICQISPLGSTTNEKPSINRKSRVPLDTEECFKSREIKIESNAKKCLNKCFKDEKNNTLIKENCENSTKVGNTPKKAIKTFHNKKNKIEKSIELKNDHCVEEVAIKRIDEDVEIGRIDEKKKVLESFNISSNKNNIDISSTIIKPLDENISNYNSIQENKFRNEVIEVAAEKTLNSENMCENDDTNSINSSSSTNSSPVVKQSRKTRTIYDSDDDFKINENIKTKLKTYERRKLIDRNSSSNSNVDEIKDCKISLTKLSEEDIGTLGSKTLTTLNEQGKQHTKNSETISSDDENINFVKNKKSCMMLNDDDDDFQGVVSKSSEHIKTEPPKKKSKSKKSSKTEKTKTSKLSSLASSSTFEADDDDFTSTPDRQQNEKRELIDKIKYLEICVKGKKQKLDNLKRASIYKSKHNIDELKNLTEQWRQGCLSGLNGLLTHLQSHGPMDMPTLLNNLKLSDNIVNKIFVTAN